MYSVVNGDEVEFDEFLQHSYALVKIRLSINLDKQSNYRIYPCIVCTFFSQFLPPKSRCALYMVTFVFMLGNLHNDTKSAKLNSFQFYTTSRKKSRQKICLALYITSVHVRQWHLSCNLFTIMIENLLHFSSISMTK